MVGLQLYLNTKLLSVLPYGWLTALLEYQTAFGFAVWLAYSFT